MMVRMKDKINIEVVANGYIVSDGTGVYQYTFREPGVRHSVGEPFVFETFEALVEWMKGNLGRSQ